MSSFFDRMLGKDRKSANEAKERLKLVLISDRTDLNPGTIDSLKDEIIEVISRYVEIDPHSVRIQMEQSGREQRLIADIPLKPVGRRRPRQT